MVVYRHGKCDLCLVLTYNVFVERFLYHARLREFIVAEVCVVGMAGLRFAFVDYLIARAHAEVAYIKPVRCGDEKVAILFGTSAKRAAVNDRVVFGWHICSMPFLTVGTVRHRAGRENVNLELPSGTPFFTQISK